jgi:hypothetical protein
MWWKRLPRACQKCQATCSRGRGGEGRRVAAQAALQADLGSHDGLQHLGSLNFFDDGGVELHRCRNCGGWWEFVYGAAGEICQVRRVAVPSAERWRERYRYARSAGMRLLIVLFLGLPSLLLVLGRLYAVLGLSADPDFVGPNPWLGLLLSLVPLGAVVVFYRRVGRSS